MGSYAGAGADRGASGGVDDSASGRPRRETERVRALVDRRAAIEAAIACARRGDVVVIAGKGHEQGQELAGGRKVPFDDVTVASEALGAVAHRQGHTPSGGAGRQVAGAR